MESSDRVAVARSHTSCLGLVFMWLVKVPLLSPVNHGLLSPAMLSTPGDNIDSEWGSFRLSNYTQNFHGRCLAQLWYALTTLFKGFFHLWCIVLNKSLLVGPLYGLNVHVVWSWRCNLWVATFLRCAADTRIQYMTAVSGSPYFEAISWQISELVGRGPRLLRLVMTHMLSRQSAGTTRA